MGRGRAHRPAGERPSWRDLVAPALIGAIAFEVVIVVFSWPPEEEHVVKYLGSILVGLVVGASVELLREVLSEIRDYRAFLEDEVAQAETLARRLKYQDQAFDMLLSSPQHGQVLSTLLSMSLSEKFKYIPQVTKLDYLKVLQEAAEHSKSFAGVQRRAIRWFMDDYGKNYLAFLRDQRMEKRRVFILNDEDMDEMQEDLADATRLDAYFELVGDAESFYISVSELKEHFGADTAPPLDSALFDDQLLIGYDENHRLLSFDLVADDTTQGRIFRELAEQIKQESSGPFHRIEQVAAPVGVG